MDKKNLAQREEDQLHPKDNVHFAPESGEPLLVDPDKSKNEKRDEPNRV